MSQDRFEQGCHILKKVFIKKNSSCIQLVIKLNDK